MIIDYPHKRGIHCETASIKNLLEFNGYEISEEMIFGIGSGYDFIHFPFPLFNGCETPLFRNIPGKIFKQFTERMNIDRVIRKFSDPEKSMETLDLILNQGIPVAIVAEIMLLPFFPLKDRNFPGHTIVIIGKEENEYIVSDTDWHFSDDSLHRINYADLKNARYPEGSFSPKGKSMYIKSIPETMNLEKGIILGIKDTCHQMLDIPIPFFGVKGILYYSKRLRIYDKKYGRTRALDNLKWQLQTSEEAGTGGSGYRYMYAHFLLQAAEYLHDDILYSISTDMRKAADEWQTFAVETLRFYKENEGKELNHLADIAFNIGKMEENVFTNLRKWTKSK